MWPPFVVYALILKYTPGMMCATRVATSLMLLKQRYPAQTLKMTLPIPSANAEPVKARTSAALKIYRWSNTSLFYMQQPLTAAASIVAPIVINRHEAANNWMGLILNSVVSFILLYFMTKYAKKRSREHLIKHGKFDIENDRPNM